MLSLFMNTRNDTKLVYTGVNGVTVSSILSIIQRFESRSLAVDHLAHNINVIYGGSLDEFTSDWLNESTQRLRKGQPAEFIGDVEPCTLAYSVTIENI